MKTNLLSGHRHHIKNGLFAVALLLFSGLYNVADAQTINIGPNQYAFQYTLNPNFGLFFNSTSTQYEFRNGSASPVFAIGAANGELRNNLTFNPSSDLLIGNNRYAFRAASNPNFGLFFNAAATEYQFTNNVGSPIFKINANSGQLTSSSGITVAGSSVFNSSLRVGGGFNGGTSSSAFSVGSATTYTAMDNNELQAYSGGAAALLYLNFWGGDINFANNTMWLDRADARLGLNTSTPTAKLDVQGKTDLTEIVINADGNYTGGNSDVRAVNGTSVISPGYGYGVYGTGGYIGVRGVANSTTYTGTSYGVYGSASGTAGTRIGVYGSAFGGTTNNWAVYAAGDSYVSGDLRVGSQTEVTGFRVSVDGKVICEELKVQLSQNWPDYVFADDYSIMNLNDLEEYIKTENHLPGIPSAAEIEAADGIMLGEMQRVTVEKLEELTLYILELKKENDLLKERVEALEN